MPTEGLGLYGRPIMDADIERFRRRAQEERDAASKARATEKKLSHENLAVLYDRVAERLEQVASRASMHRPRSRPSADRPLRPKAEG
jgi:hypothetical protein